jgi:hypothetical protein
MKCNYRGFELEVKREKCLGGWDQVYTTAYLDGYELICEHSEDKTNISSLMKSLKRYIDEIIEDQCVREDMDIDKALWNDLKKHIK